jgi:ubiquinone/menaquinone biosynthesis C-methylase UbiE
MVPSAINMTAKGPTSDYAFGHTDAEHARLIRQAARLAPLTERFFREAGIGRGQRVLDLGSGVGDVAILVSKIVGPSGEVVGVERDIRSIGRAKERVAEAGLRNVSFAQADVGGVTIAKPFDAAVGRFILQFLPDPIGVLRSLSQLVIPGGVFAFQEVSWAPTIVLAAHLPFWSASLSLARDLLERSGANTEIGFALYRIFQEAGLPAPTMKMEMLLGSEPDFTRWLSDLLFSLRPQIQRANLPLKVLGDFDTLAERLQAEVAASNTVVPGIAVVGACTRWLAREPSR